jgi:hypothetical protein
MKRALYILAILLALTWVIGFFIMKAGIFVHIFIIVSTLLLLQAIIVTPRPQTGRSVIVDRK